MPPPVWSGWGMLCSCGSPRDTSDPFLLTPNPMLPSQAGRYLLKADPRQETESHSLSWRSYASSKNATACNLRACRTCGVLYACPEGA